MEILPGIHRIEAPLGDRYVAMYLVVGADCALLVDTGIEDSVRVHLRDYLRLKGIVADRLRYAVNTHADFDHIGGNGPLKELNPEIVIACGEQDRRLITDVEAMITERYGEFRHQHGFDETQETKEYIRSVTQTVPVDIGLTGGETFELGNRRVTILHVPGHSPGHLAVYDPLTKSIMAGDCVLSNSVLTAAGNPAFPPTYRDLDAYRSTISMLAAYEPEALLTAHYAPALGYAAREFLDVSMNYCDTVTLVISDVLQSSPHPMSLMDIVEKSRTRLGPWDKPASDYLVYPILGHLESLERLKRIERTDSKGSTDPTRWNWNQRQVST